ncbi:MAG TPA: TadE/TadG family type IV pilus assembly protein [Gaiellaceae bacterium]|jgi:Flp pilus assembly protein TadG
MKAFARDEQGQTAVEFALVAPFLIAIVLAIWQLGVAFHDYVTLTDAARAGARQAIVFRFNGGTLTNAQQAVRNSASDLDQSQLGVSVTDPNWNVSGSTVTVTATYPYNISIPLLGINVASGNLSATAKEELE